MWSQHQFLYFQVAWECNLEPQPRNGILPAIPSGPISFFSLFWPFHVRNSYSVFRLAGWLGGLHALHLESDFLSGSRGFSLLGSHVGTWGNFAEVEANRFWFQSSSYECLLSQKVSLRTLISSLS